MAKLINMDRSNLKMCQLPMEKYDLFTPPLQHIAQALNKALSSNFEHVYVSVVDCPDLTKEPFRLPVEGICGDTSILDIGGVQHLLPLVNRDKIYDLKDIPQAVGLESAYICGAGAGPWPCIGCNCEMVVNTYIKHGKVLSCTRVAKVDNDTLQPHLKILPDSETRFCLLANLLCCRGETGKVLKIHCKVRTGNSDFITSIRAALIDEYKDSPIGLGGVFMLANGKARQHIMPDFSRTPLNCDDDLNKWLHFYNMSAPLTAFGTLVSSDPGWDLRVQHFHSYNEKEAGHYHYDTTPDVVEYLAYLSCADTLYRIDKPSTVTHFGKD